MNQLNTPTEIEQDFISTIFEIEGYITAKTFETSGDIIHVKNSSNVKIITFHSQQVASLYASVQALITLFLSTVITDTELVKILTREFVNVSTIKNSSKKEIFIENSRGVIINLRNNTEVISLQFLVQILLALITDIAL